MVPCRCSKGVPDELDARIDFEHVSAFVSSHVMVRSYICTSDECRYIQNNMKLLSTPHLDLGISVFLPDINLPKPPSGHQSAKATARMIVRRYPTTGGRLLMSWWVWLNMFGFTSLIPRTILLGSTTGTPIRRTVLYRVVVCFVGNVIFACL